MTFNAKIPKGKDLLVFGNRPQLDKYIESLSHSDKDVSIIVTIERAKKKRSLSQNGYYRMLLTDFVLPAWLENFGFSPDEVTSDDIHDHFKTLFNSKEIVNEGTGEVQRFPQSTTILSTTDFMAYLEHMKRWCAEWLGIVLPEPEQQLEIDTNK